MKRPVLSPRTAAVLFVVYVLLLGVVVFASRLTDLGLPQIADGTLERLHAEGILPDLRFGHVEAGANILLFIPVGFLLACILPRRLWLIAILTGVAMSLCIEFIQAVALSGRSATVRDVVCNSLGTVLGTALSPLFLRVSSSRSPRIAGAST